MSDCRDVEDCGAAAVVMRRGAAVSAADHPGGGGGGSLADASALVRWCFGHNVGAVKQLVTRRRTDLDAAVSHRSISLSLSVSVSSRCCRVQPSLVQACFNGDPDEVRAILYKKEDVNYQVV